MNVNNIMSKLMILSPILLTKQSPRVYIYLYLGCDFNARLYFNEHHGTDISEFALW